jgi:hypothetical protein
MSGKKSRKNPIIDLFVLAYNSIYVQIMNMIIRMTNRMDERMRKEKEWLCKPFRHWFK